MADQQQQQQQQYKCDGCMKHFTRASSMKRHSIGCGTMALRTYECTICQMVFTREANMLRHQRMQHKFTTPLVDLVIGGVQNIQSGGVSDNDTEKGSPTNHAKGGGGGSIGDGDVIIKDDPDMSKYVIVKQGESKNLKFRLRRKYTEFKLKPIPSTEINPTAWIKDGVKDIIAHVSENLRPSDRVGMTFSANSFSSSAYISFKKAADLGFDEVWNMLSSIFQSNSEGLNTDTFALEMVQISDLQGRGRRRKNFYNNFSDECLQRRGIVTIINNDNLCLPRALVVAMAKLTANPQYNNIRDNKFRGQDKAVMELLSAVNIKIPEEGCGTDELKKFQQYLTDYKITVYSYGNGGRNIFFEGNTSATSKINLLYHKNHYNVITSLTSAFACKYYCELCHVPHEKKNEHRCKGSCPACQQKSKCTIETKVRCDDCNRLFRGPTCFNNHKENGICDIIRCCEMCHRVVKKNRKHYCGEVFCKICKKHQPENHLCYMQCDLKKPPTTDILYVFYDLETRQEDPYYSTNSMVHEPNLCVFNQRCIQCMDNDSTLKTCLKCGIRQMIIKVKPVEIFMQYLLNQRKIFKEVIVIAHNSQGFDCQFILKYIITDTSLTPSLLMRGSKIISMTIDNVKFTDSLNYFPMSLASLPMAFGLPATFKKGYFPHLFNTIQNIGYIGRIPDMKFYQHDSMKTEERSNFLEWYNAHLNDIFDFDRELMDYCINDVEILTQACLKFKQLMLAECNICPFSEAVTIAASCNLAYRRGYLKHDTVGVIPKGGYRHADTQSRIAMKWLIEESTNRNINISHCGNSREIMINGMKVDGYCEETRQIFEFQGCYFHGHTCMSGGRDVPLPDDRTDTYNARFTRTLDKNRRLRDAGYDVIEMWECQYESSIPNNHPILVNTPLEPRDAFYGGRTENTVKHYKIKPGEKIKYFDICSLYPWVCKYGKYPIGHPTVIIGDEDCRKLDVDNINGLIKCTMLPPQNLFHPVLPIKMNSKLLFILCRTCGKSFSSAECTHSEEERALTGTWVSDEIQMALKKGYKVMKFHEIWQYSIDQLSDTSTGLFGCFINKFLKLKQEASGWPSLCNTSEEKAKYISDYLQREGVQLDADKITKNAGLRSLSKLMLNSFWGKLGQTYQSQTRIIRNPQELTILLNDSSLDVNAIREITEDVILVAYEHKVEARENSGRVNVCLAAYTTTQARLKLFEYLDMLHDRVLYFDTDSIIFISREGEEDPLTGSYLGDMVNELDEYGADSYIDEFVSGGAKTYAYHVYSPTTDKNYFKCKVKGFTLNHENSQIINFESMKKSVMEDECQGLCVKNYNIKRTNTIDVISNITQKVFKPTSIKRKFIDDHTSVPYGYKRVKLNI